LGIPLTRDFHRQWITAEAPYPSGAGWVSTRRAMGLAKRVIDRLKRKTRAGAVRAG